MKRTLRIISMLLFPLLIISISSPAFSVNLYSINTPYDTPSRLPLANGLK